MAYSMEEYTILLLSIVEHHVMESDNGCQVNSSQGSLVYCEIKTEGV
jgi:hypothetical protein